LSRIAFSAKVPQRDGPEPCAFAGAPRPGAGKGPLLREEGFNVK